ncbi:hypothetical protein F5X98DRAFT_97212 [Xylaria grammica]|nr:hypothetical protein F5X98DRAFT_97212 [Xylaria grammica]
MGQQPLSHQFMTALMTISLASSASLAPIRCWLCYIVLYFRLLDQTTTLRRIGSIIHHPMTYANGPANAANNIAEAKTLSGQHEVCGSALSVFALYSTPRTAWHLSASTE